jgi:flagellar protein FlaG
MKTATISTLTSKSDGNQQGSASTSLKNIGVETFLQQDNSNEAKSKVKDVVVKMNEMLDATNNASKFMYHEGLDRYYVSVVDRETEEIVKEIPPKKLLDAFYEMQKMLGMIVDEKI